MALAIGFSGRRFFPFSHYPLFPHRLKTPSTYALIAVRKDGIRYLLDNKIFFPMTKINVTQAVVMTIDGQISSYQWTQAFLRRALKYDPTIVALRVERIQFTNIDQKEYRVTGTLWEEKL